MPSSSTYRNYMRLLQQWPVDTSKEGLDLGQHLRNRVAKVFAHGEMSPIRDNVQCQRMYRQLHRLAINFYANRYPRSNTSSATGLSAEQCRMVISAEAMEVYRQDDKGLIRSLRDKIGI